MAEEKKLLTRTELESEIIKKAWKDPEYKKRLLESPKAVLEEELCKLIEGIKLPEDVEVTVHEETPYSIHLTLPANPADYGMNEEGEVSQTETVGTITPVYFTVVIDPVPVVLAPSAVTVITNTITPTAVSIVAQLNAITQTVASS